IQYTIWSDIYRCQGMITVTEQTGRVSKGRKNAGKPVVRKKRLPRGCGAEIILWYAGVDPKTGEVQETLKCPVCRQEWSRTNLTYLGITPVFVNYSATMLHGSDSRFTRPVAERELESLARAREAAKSKWFPADDILPQRELMTMGAGRRNIRRIGDFYTDRNRYALALIYEQIVTRPLHSERLRQGLLFIFTSVVNTSSRLRFYRPSGPGDVRKATLYVSALTSEYNVLEAMSGKSDEIIEAIRQVPQHPLALVHKGSAKRLTAIGSESVDYIYTHPPFGGNIYYA